jgi:hypothetical protein
LGGWSHVICTTREEVEPMPPLFEHAAISRATMAKNVFIGAPPLP